MPASGHEAIDIVGKRGWPILAAVSGTVRESLILNLSTVVGS